MGKVFPSFLDITHSSWLGAILLLRKDRSARRNLLRKSGSAGSFPIAFAEVSVAMVVIGVIFSPLMFCIALLFCGKPGKPFNCSIPCRCVSRAGETLGTSAAGPGMTTVTPMTTQDFYHPPSNNAG
jgi:hypothetical protein